MAQAYPGPVVRASRLPIGMACALAAIEALGLLVFAGLEATRVDTDRASIAVSTAAFFGLYASGLLAASVALWKLKGWSRGPIVLAQLIQLGVAWSFSGGGTTWLAATLALWACVCLGLVLSPATTGALYPGGAREDDPNPA